MSAPLPPQALRKRRRRRSRKGRRRGVHLLPHLFTTGNLFFGFFAIVHSSLGNFDRAAAGIVLAAVFDILDGRVARLAGSTSRFGSEYDSIADTVSFGVAPALLAYWGGNLQALGRTGLAMAFIYTACAALRLARFNVSPGRYKGHFQGLPSPAAAGMIATTQWCVGLLRENGIAFQAPELMVGLGAASLGLLMVSAIPYWSGKEVDVRHPFGSLVLVILVLAVVVQEPMAALFVFCLLYVLAGPVEWAWRRVSGRPLTETPAEPVEEAT